MRSTAAHAAPEFSSAQTLVTMNRIESIEILDHSLNSAEAEIWVNVVPARRTATTEIRGRFVGPRCPSRSTVEVAYPLRPRTPTPDDAASFAMRVVIPDPSLWTTEHPLEYDGQIELWQDGQRATVARLALGPVQSATTMPNLPLPPRPPVTESLPQLCLNPPDMRATPPSRTVP